MWNLDYNSGAPLDPRVVETMASLPAEADGNPSSPHQLGRRARAILEDARERIASELGVEPVEVVFTSGGTEANNLAVQSGWHHARMVGGSFCCSPIEHPSVAFSSDELARQTEVPVLRLRADRNGRVDGSAIAEHDPPPGFLSLIAAHHELGVIQDLSPFARSLHEHDGWLHSDASQALGRVDLSPIAEPSDLLTLSPHKVGGPRGIGVLVVRKRCSIAPVLRGGAQELGRRPGTQSPRLAAGAARAIELAIAERKARARKMQRALETFLAQIGACGGSVVCGDGSLPMLPNTRTLCFRPVEARLLLPALDLSGIFVSYGSACSSGAREPARSLFAIGLGGEEARCCLRISVGPDISQKKIAKAADLFLQVFACFEGDFEATG